MCEQCIEMEKRIKKLYDKMIKEGTKHVRECVKIKQQMIEELDRVTTMLNEEGKSE